MVDMKMESCMKGRAGFTMIEVLIAIVILSIALISLAGLLTTTIRTGAVAREATIATNLAQQRLEDYRTTAAADFDDSSLDDSAAGSDPVSGTNPDFTEDYGTIPNYPNFRREVYITDGASPVNIKDVAVRVLWTDSLGTHSTMLRTYLSR
jgi:type IV pilus assembly protein PilV